MASEKGPDAGSEPRLAPGPERITAHFRTDPDRRDVWKAFSLFLETDAYLNLGYSNWYQPHWLPSSQRRLVDELADRISAERSARERSPDRPLLLDIGSGRGGPAVRLADRWGFDVVGLDLVGGNLTKARENAREAAVDDWVAFLHGTAEHLPIASGSIDVCTAIDSLVYVPETGTVLDEAHRVLGDDGLLAITDLVRTDSVEPRTTSKTLEKNRVAESNEDPDMVSAFAREWDMPDLLTRAELLGEIERAGFDVRVVADISEESIRQFRKYAGLYLWLAEGPGSMVLRPLLDRLGLDEPIITPQVRAAYRALPDLEHVLIVAVPRLE